jgi:hypothetical protein
MAVSPTALAYVEHMGRGPHWYQDSRPDTSRRRSTICALGSAGERIIAPARTPTNPNLLPSRSSVPWNRPFIRAHAREALLQPEYRFLRGRAGHSTQGAGQRVMRALLHVDQRAS